MVSWARQNPRPKWFSHFQHRHTDHVTSVTIGRIFALLADFAKFVGISSSADSPLSSVIIHDSFTLSLKAQNTHFPRILPHLSLLFLLQN